jgi:hypothetical protein
MQAARNDRHPRCEPAPSQHSPPANRSKETTPTRRPINGPMPHITAHIERSELLKIAGLSLTDCRLCAACVAFEPAARPMRSLERAATDQVRP